jgi:hypothetical protein
MFRWSNATLKCNARSRSDRSAQASTGAHVPRALRGKPATRQQSLSELQQKYIGSHLSANLRDADAM